MSEPETKKPEEVPEDVEEIDAEEEEDVPEENKIITQGAITNQLFQNPGMLAALQDRLGTMVGTPSGYIQSLPKVVKRRLKALKKNQSEIIKIESKFYEEVHELECKYAAKYSSLFDKRKEITTGGLEPTDSECEWPSDEEDEDEESEEVKLANALNKAKVEEVDETKEKEKETEKEDENVTGVPEFWLTTFKNVDMLADMIQDHDEPILKNLTNVQVKFSESNPMGFTLNFFFTENEFFTNSLLTKEYIMRSEPEEGDPFSFEGPEIIKCKGCKIDWKQGKDVTVKVVKKTQKHKGRGTKRTVTKTVQNDSFFNFFNPPEVPEGEEEPDEDTEAILAADFELGHFIRERIVPRAVLYFTGEALEDDYDDDEEEGEEEEDGEYNEDEDPDFVPAPGQGAQNPADCKQQ